MRNCSVYASLFASASPYQDTLFFFLKKKFITIERILIILILELKCISEFKILLLNYAFFYLTKTWFFLHHFFLEKLKIKIKIHKNFDDLNA
jgi:hypothetical protein